MYELRNMYIHMKVSVYFPFNSLSITYIHVYIHTLIRHDSSLLPIGPEEPSRWTEGLLASIAPCCRPGSMTEPPPAG